MLIEPKYRTRTELKPTFFKAGSCLRGFTESKPRQKFSTPFQHISAIFHFICYHKIIFFSPRAFCDNQKALKRRLWPGSALDPAGRAYDAAQTPSRLRRVHPSPLPTIPRRLRRLDIGAFGVSFQ